MNRFENFRSRRRVQQSNNYPSKFDLEILCLPENQNIFFYLGSQTRGRARSLVEMKPDWKHFSKNLRFSAKMFHLWSSEVKGNDGEQSFVRIELILQICNLMLGRWLFFSTVLALIGAFCITTEIKVQHWIIYQPVLVFILKISGMETITLN